jgi:hypothetical protein
MTFKDKIFQVFKNNDIVNSYEETTNDTIKVIDFDRVGHKYNGRSFIVFNKEQEKFIKIKKTQQSDENIVLTNEEGQKNFEIINSTNKLIAFLPIDGKGTITPKGSFCDFAFFSSEKFYFCEFKLNALTENYLSIQKNRDIAKDQIVETIKWLDKKLEKNYCGLLKEAILISPPHFPKFNPNIQALVLFFLEEHSIPFSESINPKEI